MAADADHIIEFRAVSKSYGKHRVLRAIDLKVAAGERIVVCGPSGSGKSTLINCINALADYDEGAVLVGGIYVSEREGTAEAVRARVGMVFQQFNLFPHLTAVENCMVGPQLVLGLGKEEAEARARTMLDRVKVADQADKMPDQLSGGQQQRVAIARALSMQPRIMLFDEPTSALDPEMIKEVLDVMIELAAAGMTMIVVTHEMGFARHVADRIVMMEDGAIVADEPPARFFDRERSHPRVREFLDKVLSSR